MGQAATLMFALTNTSLTLISVRKLCDRKSALDELVALADEKGSLVLESARNGTPRLRIGRDGEACRCSPNDFLGTYRLSVNGSDSVDADRGYHFWRAPTRNSATFR